MIARLPITQRRQKIQSTIWVVAVCLVLWILPACRERTPRATPPRAGRNIIVVLSDTHRLDFVSGFNFSVDAPTPNVARLVKDGLSFSRAYTAIPISAPSYASILSGLPPGRHGLLNNGQKLSGELSLLPELLHELGYRTAGIVSNPFCSASYGFDRGFDTFWDGVEGIGKEGEIVTSEAIDWLRKNDAEPDRRPFFLFLAYMDAHVPYIVQGMPPSLRMAVNGKRVRDGVAENSHIVQHWPVQLQPGPNTIELSFLEDSRPVEATDDWSPLYLKDLRLSGTQQPDQLLGFHREKEGSFQRMANRARLLVSNSKNCPVEEELIFRCFRQYRQENIPSFYETGVRSFDRNFGALLDVLQDMGLYRETIILFLSDHGEMLGEHGQWGHVGHMWQESLRVPLIIKAPGVREGGVISRPVSLSQLRDLMIGLADSGKLEIEGKGRTSRVGRLFAATFPPEAPQLQIAVIGERYKVILPEQGPCRGFDLEGDVHEKTNLCGSGEMAPELSTLISAGRRMLERLKSSRQLDLNNLSLEERDSLRALGYLDSRQ